VLKDKVALVTGGTSGIGAAIAKRFHAEGARVIVTGTSAATVEPARTYAEALVSDAGDPQAAKELIAHIGRLDILVVNAGISLMAPLDATDEATFDALFRVHARGPFFLLKHAAPAMTDGGSIILISSVAAIRAMPGRAAYAASKAALRSLGTSLVLELSPRGIRINTITPGSIDTPINAKNHAYHVKWPCPIPLGRRGTVEEITSAALYFASDESKFTTGSELCIDGGISSVFR
jgi:NAD(P)-dependent dehydrogenase (short-subunit alcohol dehydrogenase family)